MIVQKVQYWNNIILNQLATGVVKTWYRFSRLPSSDDLDSALEMCNRALDVPKSHLDADEYHTAYKNYSDRLSTIFRGLDQPSDSFVIMVECISVVFSAKVWVIQ